MLCGIDCCDVVLCVFVLVVLCGCLLLGVGNEGGEFNECDSKVV